MTRKLENSGSSVEVSVVIVNWNSKDYVKHCLESLFEQPSTAKMEIIVVDGGSFDNCGGMLASDFPEVTFIQSPENIGFGRANNLGVKSARGEILWLLNPDTEVKGDAGSKMLEALRSVEGAGLVGARLLNSDGSLQSSCVQSLPTVLNQMLDSEFLRRLFPKSSLWGIMGLRSIEAPIEVEAVPGASIMLRSELFKSIGLFDPIYFMYGEDMDLCFKVRKAGYRVIYAPKAEVTHHGGGSSRKQFSTFSVVLMKTSVSHYLRSNRGTLHVFLYRCAMAISSVIRILLLLIMSIVSNSESRKSRLGSTLKWAAVLRWSLGGERWARNFPIEA